MAQQLLDHVAKIVPDPFANGNPMVAHVYALAESFAELQACDNAISPSGQELILEESLQNDKLFSKIQEDLVKARQQHAGKNKTLGFIKACLLVKNHPDAISFKPKKLKSNDGGAAGGGGGATGGRGVGIGTDGPASLANGATVAWGGATIGKGKGKGKGEGGKGGDDKSKLVNKCFICNSPNHFARDCDDEEAKAAVAAAKTKKEVQRKIDSKKKKSNARANAAAAEESNNSSGGDSDADSDGDFKLKGTGNGSKTEAKVQIEN